MFVLSNSWVFGRYIFVQKCQNLPLFWCLEISLATMKLTSVVPLSSNSKKSSGSPTESIHCSIASLAIFATEVCVDEKKSEPLALNELISRNYRFFRVLHDVNRFQKLLLYLCVCILPIIILLASFPGPVFIQCMFLQCGHAVEVGSYIYTYTMDACKRDRICPMTTGLPSIIDTLAGPQ